MTTNLRNLELRDNQYAARIKNKRIAKKKIPFDGVNVLPSDIFLIKKVRMSNEFDGEEKERIEKAIKHMSYY